MLISYLYKLTFSLQYISLKDENQANRMAGGGLGVDHLWHKSGDPGPIPRTHLAAPRINSTKSSSDLVFYW